MPSRWYDWTLTVKLQISVDLLFELVDGPITETTVCYGSIC